MKLYETIPPIPLEDSPEVFVDKCAEIVKWADHNLAFVHRINQMAKLHEWTGYERATVIAAYMTHAYIEQLNTSYAYFEKQPLFVMVP